MSIRVEGSLAAGAHVLTLSGVTLGPATAGSPTGIAVSTSKDFVSAGAACGLLGGQVTTTPLSMLIVFKCLFCAVCNFLVFPHVVS
jgi:hypothetical protein